MTEVIITNLALWTSALLDKSHAGRVTNGNHKAYGINKLRELILELAVRGKLVRQDFNDKPASELLKTIASDKSQLVKEGKIAKERVPKVADEAAPYQLPVGWEWVPLGNYVHLEMGQSPSSSYYNQEKNGLPFFQGKADFGDTYPTPRCWCTQPEKVSLPGDVLLSVRAPVGPTNISNIECCIGRGLAALRPLAGASTQFLMIIMRAFQDRLASSATGTTFEAVSKTDVASLLVPVAPLAEQHRIVAKVGELMALCDQLELQQTQSTDAHQTLVETLLGALTRVASTQDLTEAWTRIASHVDTLFTTERSLNQLKQAVLQLAVMGKLVPQDAGDEPAIVQLENISKKREALLVSRDIRESRDLPNIGDAERRFPLPQGWEWIRVGKYVDVRRGASPRPKGDPRYFSAGRTSYHWVKIGDLRLHGRNNVLHDTEEFLTEAGAKRSVLAPKGTLVITNSATIGVPIVMGIDGYIHDGFLSFPNFPNEFLSREFFLLGLQSLTSHLMREARGLAQLNMNSSIMRQAPMAIPPLAEQRRIVAKVEELMGLCDKLKVCLADAQTTQARLADAIVEQAVA